MSSIRLSPESSSISRSKSTIQLPYRLKNVSLDALSHSSREGIARNLNFEFRSSNDTSQRISNFIGAAELVGFGWQEIEKFKHQDSPTEELLKEWCSRDDLEEPTIGNLWDILVQLNRTDVLENCKDIIIGSTSDGAMDQDVDESKMLSRADGNYTKSTTQKIRNRRHTKSGQNRNQSKQKQKPPPHEKKRTPDMRVRPGAQEE
ncbi:hypothetical protein FSP39_016285 [Pinctada imbricata]|uniref:Death domain-containing protein n=1 Tax=Pinctada imbricata TaxID=66713 RepID=A0AA88YRK9_PINIB|nr:hypothetical protein FSP39_016285 [Pinctada imbricata]